MNARRKLFFLSGKGGSPAFDPASLFDANQAGVIYDPSRLDTMFQDVAGTVPVTADGQLVASGLDLSPNNFHWEQATQAKRPLYRSTDGPPRLEFDGVDDGIDIPGLDLSDMTLDTLCSYTPSGNDFILISRKDNAFPWFGIGVSGSLNTNLTGSGAAQNASYFNNVLLTNANRGNQYSEAQNSNVMQFNISNDAFPSVIRIGSYNSGLLSVPGPMHFIFIREGTLDANQRTQLAQYAAIKAGATI